jgi:hypothetical protein
MMTAQPRICSLLLQYRAKLDALNNKGMHPMSFMAHYNSVVSLKLMIQADGLSTQWGDAEHKNELAACLVGKDGVSSVDALELLLWAGMDPHEAVSGANVSQTTLLGGMPLYSARKDVIRTLLWYGARKGREERRAIPHRRSLCPRRAVGHVASGGTLRRVRAGGSRD